MKKRSISSLLTAYFALVFSQADCQSFEWVKTLPLNYSLNPDMVHYTAGVDAAGNSIFCGFDDNYHSYGQAMLGNLLLQKRDPSGNLLFSKSLTGYGLARFLASDASGATYLGGEFLDSLRLDSSTVMVSQNFYLNSFLAKYDASGSLIWTRHLSALYPGVQGLGGLVVTPAGEVVIGCDLAGLDSFVKKFDAAGNEVLSILQSNVRLISSLDMDASGNVYVAGSCTDAGAQFNGTPASSPFQYDTYVAKYDASGQNLWVRFIEDITCPSPKLKAGHSGNLYLSSALSDAFAFGSLMTQSPAWVYDFYLTKLDAAGNFLWVKQTPSNPTVPPTGFGDAVIGETEFLQVDALDNVYLTGFTRGTVNWDNNLMTVAAPSTQQLLVQCYDPNGNIQWAKAASGATRSGGHALAVAPTGEVFIAGTAIGALTCDSITVPAAPWVYPFQAKLSSSISLSSKPDVSASGFQLFPNPSTGQFTLVLPKRNTSGEVKVLNMLGQTVLQRAIAADLAVSLDLSTQPAGNYLVQLVTNSSHQSRLIQKQ